MMRLSLVPCQAESHVSVYRKKHHSYVVNPLYPPPPPQLCAHIIGGGGREGGTDFSHMTCIDVYGIRKVVTLHLSEQ